MKLGPRLHLVLMLLLLAKVSQARVKEVLLNSTFPSARAYASTPPNQYSISSIAVFLLASLHNAEELGEVPDSPDSYNYFQRLTAAKATWAAKALHFFGVTGAGQAEQRIFQRGTCIPAANANARHRHNKRLSYQIYDCPGAPSPSPSPLSSAPVKVLHLPHCDGSSWGDKGPCCRCSGAMSFFLDLLSHHVEHAPEYFLFSDDDYFIRLHYLQAQLSTYPSPLLHPQAIVLWGSGDSTIGRTNQKSIRQGRSGFGMGGNCTNLPCSHRFPWMGFGGFSRAAIEQLAPQIRDDVLPSVCRSFQVTHDIGFAIWTWMQGPLPLLRAVEHIEVMQRIHEQPNTQQQQQQQQFEPVVWHNHNEQGHASFSEIFQRTVLSQGEASTPASAPASTTAPASASASSSGEFNLDAYVAREVALGTAMGRILLPLHNGGGYLNTMHARRSAVHRAILRGITSNTTTGLSSLGGADPMHSLPQPWNYTLAMCDEDKRAFQTFLDIRSSSSSSSSSSSGRKTATATGGPFTAEQAEPGLCVAYSEYVANLPVEGLAAKLTAGSSGEEEELLRLRLRLRLRH